MGTIGVPRNLILLEGKNAQSVTPGQPNPSILRRKDATTSLMNWQPIQVGVAKSEDDQCGVRTRVLASMRVQLRRFRACD